jgi:5-methylcytosine-specific restriction endonuclease McrA
MTVRDTLLLDQGYQPIKVISWQRALCMHFVGKVEVLRDYEWVVQTISTTYAAPAVVRLLRKLSSRPLHVRFSRQNAYLRDNHRCQYCGIRCGPRDLTLDHVVPRSAGGKTTWRNVVTACVACNRRKGRASPEAVGMKLRSIPTRPDWLAPRLLHVGDESVPEAWRDWLH